MAAEIEFEVTWISESGNVNTDTGRAYPSQIAEWNEQIQRAVANNDQVTEIKIPTRNDGDWSDGTIRAILVKEVRPLVQRPADW